jgi:uncharacterized protein YbjT (DUF2867 family)
MRILVTGAGGTVGRALLEELDRRDVPFRAAYHDPDKLARARAAGRDAVPIDFARPETVAAACAGAGTLFLASGSDPDQTEREISAVHAARAAGVGRIVKLSVWEAPAQEFSFARIHRPVEREIERSGIAWTFLRPNSFMQNMALHSGPSIRSRGAFHLPGGDARIAHVDVRDIAAVAAEALIADGAHDGRAYDLSGPEALTYAEVAATLTGAAGRPITYVDIPEPAFREAMASMGAPGWFVDAVAELLRYNLSGRAARLTSAVKDVTGRDPISFARYARDHAAAFRPLTAP